MKKILLTYSQVVEILRTNFTANGECWEWKGGIGTHGYGLITFDGRQHMTHRLALEIKLGRALMAGFESCHTCDNRKCINPAHLFEGTRKDNLEDMTRKGRRGTTGLFTKDQVLEIRSYRGCRGVYAHLAKKFNTTVSVVWNVINRKTYKTVSEI